jgi:hypothetical protein
MKMLDFRSALAEPTTNFVRYKRGLNRKYVTEAAMRRLFDRYLNERAVCDWKFIPHLWIETGISFFRPDANIEFLASQSDLPPYFSVELRSLGRRNSSRAA